ncbi:MAG: hypothetical protein LBM77_01310 [Spirochaetaceae bacterium]|jgi:hypothetical protein|nr:hypothetical protein [Spirochaetaceae bacterium]
MPVAKQQITNEMIWGLLLQMNQRLAAIEAYDGIRAENNVNNEEAESIFTEDFDPVEWCKPIPLSAEAQARHDAFIKNYDREKVRKNHEEFYKAIDAIDDEPLPEFTLP